MFRTEGQADLSPLCWKIEEGQVGRSRRDRRPHVRHTPVRVNGKVGRFRRNRRPPSTIAPVPGYQIPVRR